MKPDTIDVTQFALCFDIQRPVLMSRAAWDMCVTVPQGSPEFEDERLWQVMSTFHNRLANLPLIPDQDVSLVFTLNVTTPKSGGAPMPVSLSAVMSYHPEHQYCAVIMLSNEETEGGENGPRTLA